MIDSPYIMFASPKTENLPLQKRKKTKHLLLVRSDNATAGVPREERDCSYGVQGPDPQVGGEGPAAGAREQGRRRGAGRAAARRDGQERRQAGAEGRRRRGEGADAAGRRRLLRGAPAPAGRPGGQAEGVNRSIGRMGSSIRSAGRLSLSGTGSPHGTWSHPIALLVRDGRLEPGSL